MLKKIRCFYWKQRDQGKGRRCMAGFVLLALCLVALGFWMSFRAYYSVYREEIPTTSVSGGAVTGVSVSGTAVSGGGISEPVNPEITPDLESQIPVTEEPRDYELDTDGLKIFLGFMTDASYETMVSVLKTECEKEQAASVTKMEYQKTQAGSSNVTSYVLSDVGSVYQVDYNLKSDSVIVTKSSYSESDVLSIKKAEDKREQKKLKKEREKVKKKQTAKKKKSKAKKKTHKDVG